MNDDLTYMRLAMEEAKRAEGAGEVPVGAVLVCLDTGKVLARAGNRTITLNDPSAHAEMVVMRDVCKMRGAQRIPRTALYVTLEPCTMCAAAISFARIEKLVFGADDEKGGAVISGVKFYDQPTCHGKPEIIGGVLAEDCGQILKAFFKARRA